MELRMAVQLDGGTIIGRHAAATGADNGQEGNTTSFQRARGRHAAGPAAMSDSRRSGMLDSLRAAIGTGIDGVHTRVQLFGVEFEQELWHVRNLIIQSMAVLLLAFLATSFLGFALIVIFWDSHRALVAILVAAFFALLATAAAVLLRRTLNRKAKPFQSILEVLERDSAALRRSN
jgi:uncharacterized membrane protein YqjE